MRLKHVPAHTGIQWVKQGVQTFFRQPFAISGLFFMFMAAMSLMSIVPFLGSMVAIAVTPAATLGLMAASRDASRGVFPMPSTLVTAFRKDPGSTRAMLILGGLYVASLLLLVTVAMVLGPSLPDDVAETGLTPEVISTIMNSPGLWFSLLVYIPILMMFWHAPALVHWHGVTPVKSLFFSLMACWTNKGAMVMYMLAWFGLLLASVFMVTIITRTIGGTAMGFAIYPLILVMASVFYASLFFTYKDSFEFDTDFDAVID
jgi:hypothetical protein